MKRIIYFLVGLLMVVSVSLAADQFHDNSPALTEQVSESIPDMAETFGYIKDVFQNFCTTWSNTAATGIYPDSTARVAKTADYTVTAADVYISASGASNTVTITLEAAATATAGRYVMVKATDVTYQVDIDGNLTETIDGSATFTFAVANEAVCLISDGSNWEILFHYQPTLQVTGGGTGAATFTDGGVLLGSGTGAITAMGVLADGEFIVGDGTTDPVAESGNTARTSLGLGTGDSPTFTGLDLTGLTDTYLPYVSTGAIADSPLTTDGTNVTNSGDLTVSGGDITLSGANPTLSLKDSDSTDSDVNASIDAQATDTGSGTEDVDVYLKQQIAGALTAFLTADADGMVTLGSASQALDLPSITDTNIPYISASGFANSPLTTDGTDVTNSGKLNMADNIISRPKLEDYSETVNALGDLAGGTDDINLTSGNVVTATVSTGAQTFTFSNPPASGSAGSFTLILTNGGSQTVTWPASVKWAGGTAPSLTAAGVDILTFITVDGGTTWYGFEAGINMS